MNPHIKTGLRETASAASNDAPKAGIVFVVGDAGRGPNRPVEITDAREAYRLYGHEGTLARDVELALMGARVGAAASGRTVYGRVVALRTKTGRRASTTLKDADARSVMKITSAEASRKANDWTIQETASGYVIKRAPDENGVAFTVREGAPTSGARSYFTTPTELASGIRSAFDGDLEVEIERGEVHFEVEVDSSTSHTGGSFVSSSDEDTTVIDFREATVSDMSSVTSGTTTWIDGVAAYFTDSGEEAAHNRILSNENDAARVYAIAPGKAVVIPQGADKSEIEQLAHKKYVGAGETNTLLSVRSGATSVSDSGKRDDTVVSEGYFRVRNDYIGRFDASALQGVFDFEADSTDEDVYAITFDAPYAIADDDAELVASAYASTLTPAATAEEVSNDRLAQDPSFTDILTLKLERLDADTREEVPLSINGGSITSTIDWSADEATVYIHKDEFDSWASGAFDDAFIYASYDTCVFDLTEKPSVSALSSSSDSLEYAVSGSVVSFNQEVEHDLIVRGLRATQYTLGSDVLVDHDEDGNTFTFHGTGNQPGPAGGAIGSASVILGFDYIYEPDFPQIREGNIRTSVQLSGGTSGVGASPAVRLKALERALGEWRDQDYQVLVPSGLYFDDVKVDADPITGTRTQAPLGLLEVLEEHQKAASVGGAPGIVYCSAKPMKASTVAGRFTGEQKQARFRELYQADSLERTRAATIIDGWSLPEFFLFDAPLAINASGGQITGDSTAFFAGIRSALTNDRALYQVRLPDNASTLYRYDDYRIDMPGLLAEARINTWATDRGTTRLADERTAAADIYDDDGYLVDSSFESGPALLAAKGFMQSITPQLENLLGPVASGGLDVLRGTIETLVYSVAQQTVGVEKADFDINEDVRVVSMGGKALGLEISVMLQVSGEIREITLDVGVTSPVDTAQNGTGVPTAA